MIGPAPNRAIIRPLNAMAATAPMPMPSRIRPSVPSSICRRWVARGTCAAQPPKARPLRKNIIAVGNQKRWIARESWGESNAGPVMILRRMCAETPDNLTSLRRRVNADR